MDRAGSVARQRGLVGRSGIPHVRPEVVRRIVRRGLHHHPVARHLGHTRRGRNAEARHVTLHDRAHASAEAEVVVLPVKDNPIRGEPLRLELCERAHRRGAQCRRHPEFVALLVRGMTDTDRDGPRAHRRRGTLALGARELLRVAHPLEVLRRRHDRTDGDRPGPRAPADLIDPDHDTVACVPQLSFESQRGVRLGHRARVRGRPRASATTTSRSLTDVAVPAHSTTEVSIVPHTHWDREWYAPFQTYRLALVHLVDGLLDLMEADPTYTRFLLDGQTALIDDYLEVRPDAAPRIERLVRDGRVQVGPWMVLMDEFMVSGETIVRDLQLGIARTRELGGDATVGYLPDMFGHVAQMPQLLRLAGIEHAVVWRGVPSSIDRTAFWWIAPDRSRVRAEYLYGSYANGRDLPPDSGLLVARARGYAAELGAAALPGGALLLMNGSDHLLPQSHLGALVATANAKGGDHHFTIRSLAEHVTTQPVDGLASWSGELRSGARANVLMGVASNRVDVHQACAAAERALERRAEPLSALFLPPDRYPHALLAIGWRNLVLNSAHDSACACSHDEVVEAVRVRYQEARHVGEALADDTLGALAARSTRPRVRSSWPTSPRVHTTARSRCVCPAPGRCSCAPSTTARCTPRRWCARSPVPASTRW